MGCGRDVTHHFSTTTNNKNMPQNAKYLNGTTSQAIKSGAGTFYGVVVNSHTSGTLKVWDNTAGSGTTLLNTISFAAGPQTIILPMGVSFYTGCFFTVGGTIDYTALYF